MGKFSLSLENFIKDFPFQGEWTISYNDETHLPKDKFIELGIVRFEDNEENSPDLPIIPFEFSPTPKNNMMNELSSVEGGGQNAKRATNIICDQLQESILRVGLKRPTLRFLRSGKVETDFYKIIYELSQSSYLILVADTGAIRKGAISFVNKTLIGTSIWTVIPVFVMNEIQNKVEELKKEFAKMREQENYQPNLGKCENLRKRPQVSCLSRELSYIQQWYPVELLTAIPNLPHGFTNDRLIVESVKNLKRERTIYDNVYLVTSDKDMASIAALEKVDTLYVGIPPLSENISSVRYDSYKKDFNLCSIHYFLWDLVQVFSTIRFHSKILAKELRLVYYSDARDGFFLNDVLEVQEIS